MKRILCIFLLGILFIALSYAQTAWMGSFKQRGSATHEIKSNDLIASHPTIPIQTKVKVTNLQNNKQVVVVITGRIVASGNRVIDLSQRVAADLDMPSKGATAVAIETIRERPGSDSK
jgi:rare lipoprotein A